MGDSGANIVAEEGEADFGDMAEVAIVAVVDIIGEVRWI